MTSVLRPLSLGELLDRTFQIYRRHFLIFVGIVGLPGLLPLCLNLLWISVQGGVAMSLLVLAVLLIVQLVSVAISQAATISAVSEVHLGRPITIGAALAAARGRIVEVVVVSLVVGLGIGLGMLLLIVPGILIALRWSVVIPVVVIERLTLRASLERSSDLTEGARGRAFLIFLLYFVMAMIVGSVWQLPILIAIAAVAGDASGAGWLAVGSAVGSFLSQCLVGPLLTIAFALFYYDQRVRKEAFDLDHMMSNLDASAGPSPATV